MKKKLSVFLVSLIVLAGFALAGCNAQKNYTVTFYLDGSVCKTLSVEENGTIGDYVATKEGFVFIDWHKGSLDGEVFSKTTKVTADVSLYAEMKAKYKVTFSAGGAGEKKDVPVLEGGTVNEADIPTFTRTGYTFNGWVYDDGTPFNPTAPITKDITVTALWKSVVPTYTVRFLGTDGATVLDTVVVEHGDMLDQSDIYIPSYYSYDWMKDSDVFDFTNLIYNDTDLVLKVYGSNREIYDIEASVFPEYSPVDNTQLLSFTLLADGTYGVELLSHEEGYLLFEGGGSIVYTDRHLVSQNYYLPYEYKGKAVTRVLSGGMHTYKHVAGYQINTLFIPNTYRVIEGEAFRAFRADNIVFEDGVDPDIVAQHSDYFDEYPTTGVEEIWSCAFQYCTSAVTLPNSLKFIEKFAFIEFRGDVKFSEYGGNAYFNCEEDAIYTKDNSTVVFVYKWYYTKNLVTADAATGAMYEFVIKDSVTSLYPGLFFGGIIVNIEINRDFDTISASLFTNNLLKTVTITGKVKTIEGDETQKTTYRILTAAEIATNPATGVRFSIVDSRNDGMMIPAVGAFLNNRDMQMTRDGIYGVDYEFMLPDGIEHIGSFAFNRIEIPTIKLPSTVTYIGENAFSATGDYLSTRTVALQKIYLLDADDEIIAEDGSGIAVSINGKFKVKNAVGLIAVGDGLEKADKTKGDRFILYASADKTVTTFEVPAGVNCYDTFAFDKTLGLLKLVLPEGVEVLEGATLSECASILEISIPASVKEISEGFHDDTWGIFQMAYNDSGQKVYFWPAIDASKLTTFNIANGSKLEKIANYGIDVGGANTRKTIKINLPSTVEEFYLDSVNYNGLLSLNIEDGGNNSFYSTGSILFEVTDKEAREAKVLWAMSNSGSTGFDLTAYAKDIAGLQGYTITEIGEYAFESNTNFVYMEKDSLDKTANGLTVKISKIGDYAFRYCTKMDEIYIPATVEFIGREAFSGIKEKAEIEFFGTTPPEMLQSKSESQSIYTTTGIFGRLENFTIKVPAAAYETYQNAFYLNAGNNGTQSSTSLVLSRETYLAALARGLGESSKTFSVTFDAGEGGRISGTQSQTSKLEGLYYLHDSQLPYPIHTSSSGYFQGWYTKDGSSNGDWGTRVCTMDKNAFLSGNVFTSETDVTLYAKWGTTPYEDGTSINFGFNLNNAVTDKEYRGFNKPENARQIPVRHWGENVFFTFTPEKSGYYKLGFTNKVSDDNLIVSFFQTMCGLVDQNNRLAQVQASTGAVLVVQSSASGYDLEKGIEYFFVVNLSGAFYNLDDNGKLADINFLDDDDRWTFYNFWIQEVSIKA